MTRLVEYYMPEMPNNIWPSIFIDVPLELSVLLFLKTIQCKIEYYEAEIFLTFIHMQQKVRSHILYIPTPLS